MDPSSFQDVVRNNIEFLLSDYGYQIKFIGTADPMEEDGYACIFSNRTTVNILKSRFDYMITIGPVGEPEFTRLSVLWILQVLSVDVEGHRHRRTDLDTFEGYVKFYTKLMRDYCSQSIEGDFSAWPPYCSILSTSLGMTTWQEREKNCQIESTENWKNI